MVSNTFVVDIRPLILTLPLSGIYPMIRTWMLRTAISLTFDFTLNALLAANIMCVYSLKLRSSVLIQVNSAWVSNNIEGSYKRSVTLAMVISL